jgi:small subunit ribosomal protein S21
MAGVIVREQESIDQALRRFKRVCMKAGILSDLRKRRYSEKPSERRKRKLNAARRRKLKKGKRQVG